MGLEIGISSLGLEDRIDFFRTLASWLTSGGGTLPVNEAINNTCDVFSRDEYKTLKSRMDKIARDYDSGETTLAQSLQISNLGFEKQELEIIKAAEGSNQLRVAIPALVDALDMRKTAKKLLAGKLTMPLVGGFMLILMTLGVMIFMLPTIMNPVLQRNPEALEDFPIIIQGFWAASVWLRNNYTLTASIMAAPVVIFIFRNTKFLKPYVEKVLMGFGPTRRIILAFNAVIIVYFMPALVRASLPLAEVLVILSNSLNNMMISNALKRAAHEHDQGYRLGDALAGLPIKSSFRSAVEAGEKTGKIAERVEDLKDPYANEFERIVKKAVGVLTLIVMAVLMPLFIISMYTSLVTPMIALMEY